MTKLRILLLLLWGTSVYAQSYSFNDFHAGTAGVAPTAASITNSWTGVAWNGASSVSNSASALLYTTTSHCGPSFPPNSSGLAIDYSTTQGSGNNNQFVQMFWPTGATSINQGAFWFCSDIPSNSAAFNSTDDAFQLIAGVSALSNFLCNGTQCGWNLEGNGGQGEITYTPGTWVQVTWQYVVNGACVKGDFSDCVRLRLYDANGNWMTNCFGGGCTADQHKSAGNNNPVADMTYGNGNAVTLPAGFHTSFMNVKVCFTGCSASQFPTLLSSGGGALLSSNVLSNARATDWTKAGLPGSALPSANWTQSGSTISAGASVATINAALATCAGTKQFVLLGPGTFSLTARILIPAAGNCVLRGSGANSTFLTAASGPFAGCGQGTALICGISSDTTNTQSPGTVANWTAGYAQASNSITVSSTVGITANSTMLMLDQCDTGFSTAACTGSATDNGQLFICGDHFNGTTGCSGPGPDAGGLRIERGQLEIHTATVINGNVLTITPPLIMPNWTTGQSPQMWHVQPISLFGVENLSLDGAGLSTQIGIEFMSAYNWWVSGVKIANVLTWGFNCFQCANGVFKDNYVTHIALSNNPYGVRISVSGNNLVQNNIIQQATTPFSFDGSATGNVVGYNFVDNALFRTSTNVLQASFNEHAEDYYDLSEGNIATQHDCDGVHGTCDMQTRFRNFYEGWESAANQTPLQGKTAFTTPINDAFKDRYNNTIGNVLGTPGYHAAYISTSCPNDNTAIYWSGTSCPYFSNADSLTPSTSMKWGNYDVFNATVRFLSSEVPTGALVYPNFVPANQTLPNSFYLTAKPAWFGGVVWPPIGPDVANGNVAVCSGTLNTVGQFAGVPTTSASKCTGTGLGNNLARHVNAIPAMLCALNIMNMPLDGSGGVLPFDPTACYGGASLTPSSFTWSAQNVGTQSPTVGVFTYTATGVQVTISSITFTGTNAGDFTETDNCPSPLTPGNFCTINARFTPGAAGSRTATINVNGSSPQSASLNGTGVSVTVTPTSSCPSCPIIGYTRHQDGRRD